MLNIQNKIEFEDNCWVAEVDASTFNSSEENRIKAVTDLASITRGKLGFDDRMVIHKTSCENRDSEGKLIVETEQLDYSNEKHSKLVKGSRIRLYNKLLTESNGSPSTPFEFVPVNSTLYHKNSVDDYVINHYYKYGIINESENEFFTNLRNELNYNKAGGDLFNASEEVKDFKVIVGRVPMKVISHLRTHRAFSWLVESSRNKRYLNEVEFWYPSWWWETFEYEQKLKDEGRKEYLGYCIEKRYLKPEEATMELSDRRLVHFAMAAWLEPNAWDNLFAVRGDKTGTMSITGITVDNIKKLIYG